MARNFSFPFLSLETLFKSLYIYSKNVTQKKKLDTKNAVSNQSPLERRNGPTECLFLFFFFFFLFLCME